MIRKSLFFLCLITVAGCTRPNVEEDSFIQGLHEQKFFFNQPMMYLCTKKPDKNDDAAIKLEAYCLVDGDDKYIVRGREAKYYYKDVFEDEELVIVSSYKVTQTWLTSGFAGDDHALVVQNCIAK